MIPMRYPEMRVGQALAMVIGDSCRRMAMAGEVPRAGFVRQDGGGAGPWDCRDAASCLPTARAAHDARFALELFIGGEEMLDFHQPVLGESQSSILSTRGSLTEDAQEFVRQGRFR